MAANRRTPPRRLVARESLTLTRAGARPAAASEQVRWRPLSLALLVFSDARVQDLSILVDHIRSLDSKPDLILYGGDDLDRFHSARGINRFAELAAQSKYGLIAVAGNDDEPSAARLITGRRVYDAHGRALLVGPFAVVGLAGSPFRPAETTIGLTLYPEAEMAALLEHGLTAAGDRPVILLSHTPPRGTLDRAVRFGEEHIGADAVASSLREHGSRIPLVVCGHVHGFGGRDAPHGDSGSTRVVNAASHDAPYSPLKVGQLTVTARRVEGAIRTSVSTVSWEDLSPVRVAAPAGATASALRSNWTRNSLHLVDQIGWVREQLLRRAGIRSVQDLATASPALVGEALRVREAVAQGFVTRARAVHLQEAIPLAPLGLPCGDRVFIDIETDLSQSHIWMCGCLDGQTGEFVQFSAQSLDARHEGAMLEELSAWLALRAAAVIVHYSGTDFDGRILRARLGAFALSRLSNEHWVDAMPLVRRAIAPASGRYALKEVAASAGYVFRHRNLDGLWVACTYLDRLRRGEAEPITAKLLEYNEDDVRSVDHVCRWVEAQCGAGTEPVARSTNGEA